MDERHNRIMAYVLDHPEAAARELAALRDGIADNPPIAWLVTAFLLGFLVGLWLG